MSPARKRSKKPLPIVLVVEDDADARELYGAALERAGYVVVAAETWREALAIVHERRPAVVVMDRHLPDADGWDATKRLKAEPVTSWIPVIALTADTARASVMGALDAGADAFLAKPCEPDVLVETVGRLLRDEPTTGTRRRPKA